ncbi:MAG: hypothetical protein K8T20_12220 [Planctomycetes bacterium]|nr:hypothetical protein [Planctomycetota bacterium]
MRRALWPALLALAAGCGRSPSSPTPIDPPARTATPGIAEAIAKLGDENYDVRRKAGEALLEAGRESLPYLAEARQSRDPEVRVRAVELTETIEQEPLVWVGVQDERWDNAENWSPKHVPGPLSIAIIPEAPAPLSAPVIRGEAEVRDLVLLRKSDLTVEELAHLKVNGRLRSRGTLRALGVVQSTP